MAERLKRADSRHLQWPGPDRPQGQRQPFVALPLPGVPVFGKTSKMGQRDIRNLPIIGAMALVRDS